MRSLFQRHVAARSHPPLEKDLRRLWKNLPQNNCEGPWCWSQSPSLLTVLSFNPLYLAIETKCRVNSVISDHEKSSRRPRATDSASKNTVVPLSRKPPAKTSSGKHIILSFQYSLTEIVRCCCCCYWCCFFLVVLVVNCSLDSV